MIDYETCKTITVRATQSTTWRSLLLRPSGNYPIARCDCVALLKDFADGIVGLDFDHFNTPDMTVCIGSSVHVKTLSFRQSVVGSETD